MKPIQTTQFVNSGNFDGDSVEFGFDQNSLAHLQSILSDLYSNPWLAVLRELSTNGLDAQIANGYTGPVEISLPSGLSPTLKIQDFGVGMSLDDLYKTYTKYGASTKRDTNDQVGMLGIGSKSPLAVADSFSVVTVHNGLKVSAVVSKNEHGIGQLQIIDTSPTSDHSGTTITIPTDHSYHGLAADLFKFWKKGTVLVDGKEPATLTGTQIDENTFLTPQLDRDYIVMGNIAYPVGFTAVDGAYYNVGLIGNREYNRVHAVVRVPIGAVHFAPSREELNYSKYTLAYLRQLRVDTMKAVADYAASQAELLDTHAEVIEFIGTWRQFNIDVDLPTKWRGKEIPRALKMTNGYEWTKHGWRAKRRIYGARNINIEAIYSDTPPIFITGWDREGVTSTIKNRMNLWMEQNKEYDTVIFCDHFDDPDGWFADVPTITVTELKALKLPKVVRNSSGKIKGSYDVMQPNGYWDEETTLVGDPLFCSRDESENIRASILQFDRPVVRLGRNRWDKFKRDFPNAEHISDFIQKKASEIQWTEEDQILESHFPAVLRQLDAADIDDPELVKWITIIKKGTTPNLQKASKLGGCGVMVPRATSITNPFEKRYPLIGAINIYYHSRSSETVKHLVLYLNTVYAAIASDN